MPKNSMHNSQRGSEQAERRRCPSCERGAALSERFELREGDLPGEPEPAVPKQIGSARCCNYCGHLVGIARGEGFGR